MQPISITGIGSYLPELMHTNETLPPLDKPITPEAIERIGVFKRGWASDLETPAFMASRAAERALAAAEITDPSTIDLIILANWTRRRYIPEWAPAVQRALGATKAFAFDVSGACTGFIYGCSIAANFLQNPRFERALVLAAETTSRRARPMSKATLILGDAAGAFVLEKGARGSGRLIDYELYTDGEHHDIMDISPEGWVRTHIPQRELNHLAGNTMRTMCATLLERNSLSLDDIDWLIPHSGTAGVQAVVQRVLEIDGDRVLTNYADIGNVSSASIPSALDHFVATGQVQKGQLILSPAVGTGWYGAAMLYRV